jgi:hypothetical protein
MAGSYFVSRVEAELQREKPRRSYRAGRYLALTAESRALGAERNSKEADDWARFFCQPIVAYSNKCREVDAEESQKMRFELVEMNNPGSHYEFLIREGVANWLVEWKDLPEVNAVREYLKTHGFPDDKCYSEGEFLDEVENGSGEIFLCVEKRRTADFILNLCHELIGESA